ncbi:hypothetical protein [Escherichia coli]|uniref:hypothetical protein n=1 Tax=Escherichia coli TaxID=562 RepID=UPI00201B5881|nr:hypothetical protein [Escherichia coli]
MTQTLNPVITVTVSGPVGSGKSYVLARIEEVVKQEFGNSVIVDAADVDGERRMSGDDLSTWQKPRAGTVIRLEEYTGQGLLSCKRKLTAVCSHQTRIGNLDAHLI